MASPTIPPSLALALLPSSRLNRMLMRNPVTENPVTRGPADTLRGAVTAGVAGGLGRGAGSLASRAAFETISRTALERLRYEQTLAKALSHTPRFVRPLDRAGMLLRRASLPVSAIAELAPMVFKPPEWLPGAQMSPQERAYSSQFHDFYRFGR